MPLGAEDVLRPHSGKKFQEELMLNPGLKARLDAGIKFRTRW